VLIKPALDISHVLKNKTKQYVDENLQKMDMRNVLQPYLSCLDVKKRISEFMKSRLLQPDMEQPLLSAKEQCLLIYLNVTSYVALW
jgi:hypothetical protein